MKSKDERNPFSPPMAESVQEKQANSNPQTLDAIARSTFLAWEKLRLLYIAILGVITIAACLILYPYDLGNLIVIVPSAFAANVCYFAGPAIDTYIRWLGYRELWPRLTMFTVGTCLSAILAVLVLSEALI